MATLTASWGLAGAQTFQILVDTSPAALTETTADGNATIQAYKPFEIKTTTNSFIDALNAFDAANDDTWKAVDTKVDFSGTLSVSLYTPEVFFNGARNVYQGALSTKFTYTPGASGTPAPIQGAQTVGTPPSIVSSTNINGKAVWIQSVSTSRPLNDAPPLHLDIKTGNADTYGGPFYPYQFNGSSFQDSPSNYANYWIVFQAYLVVPNFTADTLTVYDGIQWGYQVTLNGDEGPGEGWGGNPPRAITTPSTVPVIPYFCGLLGLAMSRRRRVN